jgi:hypothetical protein
MTCTQTQTLLDAYADHALPAWQTSRVRRHLTACPACAAELADILRLGAAVLAWHDVSAPAGLGDRLAALLPPFVSAPAPPRNRRVARRAAIGFGGVAAATGLGLWFLPGQPSQPTIAFADVVKAMSNIKIMGKTEDDRNYDATGKLFHHHTIETWVSVDPPMVATIRFPTVTYPFREQLLETANGTTVMDRNGKYYITDNIHKVADDVSDEIRQYAQPLDELATPEGNNPFGIKGSPKVLAWERTTLHGQPVIKFVQSSSGVQLYPAVSPGLLPQKNVVVDNTIAFWIDSKTHRIAQYENHTTAQGKPDYNIKWYNVSYDQMPPPGLFVNFPPHGAKVVDKRRRLKQSN